MPLVVLYRVEPAKAQNEEKKRNNSYKLSAIRARTASRGTLASVLRASLGCWQRGRERRGDTSGGL